MHAMPIDERDELRALMQAHEWRPWQLAKWSDATERQVFDALEGRPVYSWTRRRLLDSVRAMARFEDARPELVANRPPVDAPTEPGWFSRSLAGRVLGRAAGNRDGTPG